MSQNKEQSFPLLYKISSKVTFNPISPFSNVSMNHDKEVILQSHNSSR